MLDNKILHNQLISRRIFLIGAGKLGLLSLLAARMFYMQLIKKDEYKTLSDKNRINLILIPPYRGKIYDIEGTIIATNRSCFRLFLDRNISNNYKHELNLVSNILKLSQERQAYIIHKIKNSSKTVPVLILDHLNWQQLSLVEEQKLYLNSVFIDMGYSRFYPMRQATCHVIGYTGRVNKQEMQKLNINYLSDCNIGKSGIEQYYEEKLRGKHGYKQLEVNAFGKQVREIKNVESTKGEDLYLNIDARLQKNIQPYLNKQGCSVIVMDCTNGNVLILATSPIFEPNNFNKLSQDYWDSLLNDPYKPLINKAVQSTYPPGSVFKIIPILAALEAGITPDKTVYCRGTSIFGSNSFRCSKRYGHGKLNMLDAIKYSCNSYMYELSSLIGSDKIIEMAKNFGFGTKTGIDLIGEASGFLPSAQWKKDRLGSKWMTGDTLNLSIGQGFLLATPIQLARLITAIASNGKLYVPRLVQSDAIFQQIHVKQKYFDILKDGMYKAVNTIGGSAYYSRILAKNHQLAGKTGTAQVQSKANVNDDLSRQSIAWTKRNHSVFIGFAPYQQPRYSIVVFVDHGGSGSRAAAPIARNIMSKVLEKYI